VFAVQVIRCRACVAGCCGLLGDPACQAGPWPAMSVFDAPESRQKKSPLSLRWRA